MGIDWGLATRLVERKKNLVQPSASKNVVFTSCNLVAYKRLQGEKAANWYKTAYGFKLARRCISSLHLESSVKAAFTDRVELFSCSIKWHSLLSDAEKDPTAARRGGDGAVTAVLRRGLARPRGAAGKAAKTAAKRPWERLSYSCVAEAALHWKKALSGLGGLHLVLLFLQNSNQNCHEGDTPTT